jgi:ankyrin repeat protein
MPGFPPDSIIAGMAKKNGGLSSHARGKTILDRAGRSPLHYAAAERDSDYVSELIQEGADVNLADKNGWTPLHFAAQSNNAEIARLLLDSGAFVDPRDGYGNTPLSTAVFNSRGDGELIGSLRTRGANPNSKNESGVSPVRLARTIANYNVAQFFADLDDA